MTADELVLRQFEAAATRRNLILPAAKIIADGKIHRCDVRSKRGKHGKGDGTYLLHADGAIPAGGFQNFTDGQGWENWSLKIGRKYSPAEQGEAQEKWDAARKAREEDRARTKARAREKARRLWSAASACPNDHAYLTKKGVTANGARLLYRSVIVPLLDANDAIQNVQFIHPDGTKTFLKGGAVTGFFYCIEGEPGRICIAEGFATAATVHAATGRTAIVAFDAGNLSAVAEVMRRKYPDAEIVLCADDDKNSVGLDKATAAARASGGLVAIPDFGINRRECDTDFNDLAGWIGVEAVKRCIEDATAPPAETTAADDQAKIAGLAKLSVIDFDRQRKAAAEELGVKVGTLEREVAAQRKELRSDRGDDLPHWQVEPWPETVDGAELLNEIRSTFRRYILLPQGSDVALALWTLHTWTFDAGEISPFLLLVSPTKRCGKTSTLIIVQYLTCRSELASNITGPALFRYIEQAHPTLLIDEADTFVKNNEELRGILNAGHTKAAAYVRRTVEINGEHISKRFSVWSPKALAFNAAKDSLADTHEDRGILVRLQRKSPGAKVDRLRRRDNDGFATLRRKAARWSADNIERLTDPDPEVPEALNDRAADNWRPLLAIADLAAGEWPELARAAALTLSGESADQAVGVMLLRDCDGIFGDDDVIRSADLVTKLSADPERPWAEYNHGKPITQRQVADLLGPFQIFSSNVRPKGGAQGKGYRRVDFEAAWRAYCPSPPPDPQKIRPAVPKPVESTQVDGFASVPGAVWDGSKNSNLSNNHAPWDVGTAKTGSSQRETGNGRSETDKTGEGQSAQADHETDGDGRETRETPAPTSRPCPPEPAPPRAQVEQPPERFADYPELPAFLDRRRKGANPPALGPPGDSLDDFK